MNYSGRNNSTNSPGFVYFDTTPTEEYHNKSDTTEFPSFGEERVPQVSPQPGRFRPNFYSSPSPKQHRGGYRNYTTPTDDYQNKSDTADFVSFGEDRVPQVSPQGGRFRPSFYRSSTPNQHRGNNRNYPPNNRKYQRWSGGNRSHSNYNHNSSAQEGDEGISRFLHPSFVEDPWAQLEANLNEKRQCTNEQTVIEERT